MIIGLQTSVRYLARRGVSTVLDEVQQAAGCNHLRLLAGNPTGPLDYVDEPPLVGWTGLPAKLENYANTPLRPRPMLADLPGARRRAVIDELLEEKKRRGLHVHIRYEMGPMALPPGDYAAQTIDYRGNRQGHPCLNHPDWINFLLAQVDDTLRGTDIDGWLMMNECSFPLQHVLTFSGSAVSGPLTGWGGKGPTAPGCFCEHCQRDARARGIDVEAARRGLGELIDLVSAGREGPLFEGPLGFLRAVFNRPAVVAWHQFQIDCAEKLSRTVAAAVRAHGPGKTFAQHVLHPVCFDPFYRMAHDYTRHAAYADWVVPVVYHFCAGQRADGHLRRLHAGIGGHLSFDEFLRLWYSLAGYDPAVEPDAAALVGHGFSTDFIKRELTRVRRLVGSRVPIVAALGWHITRLEHEPLYEDDASVEAAVKATLEAGADGMVLGRGYPEGSLQSLAAAGRALKAAGVWDGRKPVPFPAHTRSA